MSDCCEFTINADPIATAMEVKENVGTLSLEDGATLEVTQSVTVLQMHEEASLSLEVSPPLYQVYPESTVPYDKEVDFVGETYIYRGEAAPGTATSAAGWRIQRFEFVGPDEDVRGRWAEGTATEDKIWDNRLTYNY